MQLSRLSQSSDFLFTASELHEIRGGWSDASEDRHLETVSIPAAITKTEDILNGTIRHSVWEYTRTGWPRRGEPIELPRPPHIKLLKFHYRTDCGDWIAVGEDTYRIDKHDSGWQLRPCSRWPCGNFCEPCGPNQLDVRVIFEAGYECFAQMPADYRMGFEHVLRWIVDQDDLDMGVAKTMLEPKANVRAVGHYG